MEHAYDTKAYDPRDVQQYYGKTFVTESGSEYKITEDGRIFGRKSIDGAKVMMIASINHIGLAYALDCLDSGSAEKKVALEKTILEYGEEPESEYRVVFCLTQDSVVEKQRQGFITSPLDRII